MRPSRTSLAACAVAATLLLLSPGASAHRATQDARPLAVSILAYHRFGSVVRDTMTVRTATFRAQMAYLTQHRYQVVPLRTLVSYLLGHGPAPPPRAVVITVDDGHASVFSDMQPVVREYHAPVTLFVYPSAISNASYAMTWDQLATLQRSGLFDVQSHTYWHPNFKTERRRLPLDAYRTFVSLQFAKPRTVLLKELGVNADLLAWPFGIYDDDLIAMACESGYVAGFTIERRVVTPRERIMALPRFLVTEDVGAGRAFAAMLPEGP